MSFPTHRFAFATSRAQALFSRALDSRKKSLAPEPDGYAPDYDALVRAAAGLPGYAVIETIEYHDDPLDGRYCYPILKDRLPGGHENVIELGWDVVEDLDCVVFFDPQCKEDARGALGEFEKLAGALHRAYIDTVAINSRHTIDPVHGRAFAPRFDVCAFDQGGDLQKISACAPEDYDLAFEHVAGGGWSSLIAGVGLPLFEAFALASAQAGSLMGEWDAKVLDRFVYATAPSLPTFYTPGSDGVHYYLIELKERYECDPRNPGDTCYPRFSKYSSLKEFFEADSEAREDFAGIPEEKILFREVDKSEAEIFYGCCIDPDPLVCVDREADRWARLWDAVVRPWNPRVNFYRVGAGPVTPTLREYADTDAFLADFPWAEESSGALEKVERGEALAQLGLCGIDKPNKTADLLDCEAVLVEHEPICYDEAEDAWTDLCYLLDVKGAFY